MSKHTVRTLTCPKCGAENEVVLWDSVNVTLDPEMKGRILNGDFFKHQCHACKCSAGLVYSFLYHDMDKQLMVYLIPEGERTEEQESELRSGQGMESFPMPEEMGYELRIVGSPSDLMEKIKISDASKDDRVIELCKFFALSSLTDQVPDFDPFCAYYERDEEDLLVFFDVNRRAVTCSLSEELYQNITRDFGPVISEMKRSGFEMIDQVWAMSLMKEE